MAAPAPEKVEKAPKEKVHSIPLSPHPCSPLLSSLTSFSFLTSPAQAAPVEKAAAPAEAKKAKAGLGRSLHKVNIIFLDLLIFMRKIFTLQIMTRQNAGLS